MNIVEMTEFCIKRSGSTQRKTIVPQTPSSSGKFVNDHWEECQEPRWGERQTEGECSGRIGASLFTSSLRLAPEFSSCPWRTCLLQEGKALSRVSHPTLVSMLTLKDFITGGERRLIVEDSMVSIQNQTKTKRKTLVQLTDWNFSHANDNMKATSSNQKCSFSGQYSLNDRVGLEKIEIYLDLISDACHRHWGGRIVMELSMFDISDVNFVAWAITKAVSPSQLRLYNWALVTDMCLLFTTWPVLFKNDNTSQPT